MAELKVKRTFTIEYTVDESDYEGMTLEEAVAHEEGLDIDEVLDTVDSSNADFEQTDVEIEVVE